MAVDQVEDLPVSAGKRIERCPDPAVAGCISVGERQAGGPTTGEVVISRVKESESLGEIPGCPGGLRRSARSGPRPIAVKAFPAPEREQPGPHPAGILQAPD
jgi:hypothetical protein